MPLPKGYKQSAETIKKIFETKTKNNSFKHSEETKKRMSLASKGKPKSEEHRKNLRKSHLGYVMPEEQKIKIGEANKGKKKPERSEEHRHKLSLAKKKEYKNGRISHLKQIWKDNPDFLRGENNANWKGGISKIDKLCRTMNEYKQWRSDVFTRDNWTCQTCGTSGIYVTAHHKKGFSKILKENNIKSRIDARKCSELWDIDNGVTLCEECHKLTDNYKGKAKRII